MATTYIRIKCSKCGYSCNRAIYGYVEDPIGVPLMRCPVCGSISADKSHKEWVQMSGIKKFFSIAPRANIAMLLPAVFMAFVIIKSIFGDNVDSMSQSEVMPLILVVCLLSWFICLYAWICIRVNSWFFYSRYLCSIKRTRNEAYRELLKSRGKIYDESIPPFIIFTASSKATIEYEMSKSYDPDFVIPSIDNSINNI